MRRITNNSLLKKKIFILFPLPRSAILLILRLRQWPLFKLLSGPFLDYHIHLRNGSAASQTDSSETRYTSTGTTGKPSRKRGSR